MDVLKTQTQFLKEQPIIVPILYLIRKPITALSVIHQKYGDLVLVSFFKRKLIFVCNPKHVEEVYNLEAKELLSRDFLYEAKKPLFGDGIVNSKIETWSVQRRLMQPLFTRESVIEWEKAIINETELTKNKLINQVTGQINLSQEIKRLIQSIFIQVLLGRSVAAIANHKELVKAIETITNHLLPQLVSHVISNGKLMRLMPIKNRNYKTAIKKLSDLVDKEIALKTRDPGHDLISLMIKVQDKKTAYSMTQKLLKDESINLLFAGQETTVNALSWFFYLIGQNEAVHHKITEEVRQYKDDPLNAAHLEKLTYTKAALYETLRLYPPTAALSVKAIEDVVIGGYPVNKGTTVILSMYATHRHARVWEKPNDFYPEHFLNQQAVSERHKYAFFPFGGGLHNCIGRHFAELEMMIVIVSLLRQFTFSTQGDIKEASSITIKPDKDIMASIKPVSAP